MKTEHGMKASDEMRFGFLMENRTDKAGLTAEHGLSIYIEACGKKMLFDAGATELMVRNAERMGVDQMCIRDRIYSSDREVLSDLETAYDEVEKKKEEVETLQAELNKSKEVVEAEKMCIRDSLRSASFSISLKKHSCCPSSIKDFSLFLPNLLA